MQWTEGVSRIPKMSLTHFFRKSAGPGFDVLVLIWPSGGQPTKYPLKSTFECFLPSVLPLWAAAVVALVFFVDDVVKICLGHFVLVVVFPGVASPWLAHQITAGVKFGWLGPLAGRHSGRGIALVTYGGAGLVTNSILFCWLFKIRDRCKKVRFQQTHNQGLRQLLLTVSWDLRA